MTRLFQLALMMIVVLFLASLASAQELRQVRVAVLKVGTVNWELSTIKANGFDTANGFDLVVLPFADNAATRVAFEGSAADIAVVDWIWAARQRAEGRDFVFIPYSKAVGGLVVPADSPARTLADLKGGRIGIAGGPLDKSWLILRAYAQQKYGMDLAAETEQVFGAPPLMYKVGLSGEADGVVNFWHFLARMKAEGMRELVSVGGASAALGLDPDTPLLGYVVKESFLLENPGIAGAFYHASRAAKDLLAHSDAAWEGLRPMMHATTEAQFLRLRDDFRAGIPQPGPVDAHAADRFLRLMVRLGGKKLVGQARALPVGLFAQLE